MPRSSIITDYTADYLQQHLPTALFASVSGGKQMFLNDNSCKANCSGHGDCMNGTCFCEVEYSGGTCNDPNFKYYVSFSTVYYMICVVSFIQLMLCINSEIARQKPRNIRRAFRISTQKALYFFICLGTAIRGFYFSSPANSHIRWAESLMSAYYPILMSGSSLVVCFWAEVFHLNASVERSRFLSKSITGFVCFNIVTYSLLFAELGLFVFTDSDKDFYTIIFNTIYAVLMLVVVIAFLIYGVEVFVKMRGAFIQSSTDHMVQPAHQHKDHHPDLSLADMSQLSQSRLGLISQAVLLLVTILFMMSEVCGTLWKDKVPVMSRNFHQIMFRVVEFGVALWFPCVLWNCIEPEKLWILNPRKILKRSGTGGSVFQIDDNRRPSKLFLNGVSKSVAESESLVGGTKGGGINNNGVHKGAVAPIAAPECFICYESQESKPEAGPLIQPCACRGDVSAVHHECLIRWLMEAYPSPNAPVHCKVCATPYRVEHGTELICLPSGLSITHWVKTAAIVTIMCLTLTGSCLVVKTFTHMYVKTISVGSCILLEYICLRLLGFNLIAAYHRAKFQAIKIIGRKITSPSTFTSSAQHHHHVHLDQSCIPGVPGTSGLCAKYSSKAKAEVHEDYSDDDLDSPVYECYERDYYSESGGGAAQIPLKSLSETVQGDDAQLDMCSSIACENNKMDNYNQRLS